jgi:hypothetical protein
MRFGGGGRLIIGSLGLVMGLEVFGWHVGGVVCCILYFVCYILHIIYYILCVVSERGGECQLS